MIYFLASTINISSREDNPIFIGCDDNSEHKVIKLEEMDLSDAEIIVFNQSPIIDYFRHHKLTLPRVFIDLFQIYKLIKGQPIKYHRRTTSQLVYSIFCELGIDKNELGSILDTMSLSHTKVTKTEREEKLIHYLILLKEVYRKLLKLLIETDEETRYYSIEKPFNNILLKRQYEGIFINQRMLNGKIDDLNHRLSALKKELRYEYNVTNFNDIDQVNTALKGMNFAYLPRISGKIASKSVWRFVKSGAEYNVFLKLLYDSYRMSFDLHSLRKIIVNEENIIYPVFDCYGTVTSRTQVRSPLIQHLRKTSRDFLVAKDDYVLVYADYSQFEPGILASLSEDENLIQSYNNEDIYDALSLELFKDTESRPLCKVIFLSFMYGMSRIGLSKLLIDYNRDGGKNGGDDLDSFFGKFAKLIPFKLGLEAIALKNKKLNSKLGNYRYINSDSVTHLPSKVKRWLLGQKIQGTASLILKTAVLKCCEDEQIEFLIPMHDAALFQVPLEFEEQKKQIIKKEFENAMLAYCPALNPKVVFKRFTE